MIIKKIDGCATIDYKCGDFFFNEDNELRRVIETNSLNTDRRYGIQVFNTGKMAVNSTKETVKQIIEHYVANNGPIKKVEVKEISYVEVQ